MQRHQHIKRVFMEHVGTFKTCQHTTEHSEGTFKLVYVTLVAIALTGK